MLDVARPEARPLVRSHPGKLGWGIVDAILALILLPIGAAMLVIESLVNVAAWLFGGRSPTRD
jgi:hypothetical protein